ncbi:hypothetical protein COLO4_05658 [Corchorus olitorius]|uniref:Uncharacterized protein n=1 Tax=Corchorus olitorius TaxID=93759 RepID=A0A1R3KQ96_9ROSI|nr:hypothetical protein COLO4_05658 [Corchorus olitorius]
MVLQGEGLMIFFATGPFTEFVSCARVEVRWLELAKGMSNQVTFSSFLFVIELPLIPENDCVMQQMDLYVC